ncbi:OmpH family outer membrane protein [Halanaerobaculum tunisiense]
MKNKLFVLLILSLSLVSFFSINASAANDDLDIGYIDYNKVFEAHPEMQEMNEQLSKEMQDIREKYQTKTNNLDPQEDKEQMKKLQEEFRNNVRQLQEDLAQEAKQNVKQDIKEIRKDLGLDLIIKKKGLVSSREDLESEDVTEEIVNRFKDYD